MLQRVSPLPPMAEPSLVRTQAYIDGAWVDGSAGRFDVHNPADGGKLAEVANCDAADAERAIAAAARAWPAWRARTAKDRPDRRPRR
jgi:succinate-semialdehyde dehydrogenase/glutarate-semialdehyde dehydrogenase